MRKQLKPNDVFKTSDLKLGSTLAYFNFFLEAIDRTDSQQKVFFIFRRDEDGKLDQIISDFWQHKISVEPILFLDTVKNLKSQIYQN